MSFSSTVKDEIAKLKLSNSTDVIGELTGFIPMCASLKFINGGIEISFNTENAAVARRIFTHLKKNYSEDVEVVVSKSKQLKKNNIYSIILRDESSSKALLYDTEFIRSENVFIKNYSPYFIKQDIELKKSYIRGSFLGGGSISNPEKYYHIEFVVASEDHAIYLSELINSFGFNSKWINRKDNLIVYIKEAEQISDLLNLMGASKSVLKFENIRVFKDVNNQVNRIVNLENANLNRIVNTSIRQIMDIKLIDETIGLNNLPDSLKEVASLRLSDDTLSLKELGQRLNPPIGKSGVNHRLKKINEIANKLRRQ